jgi:hypothetical protein
VWGNERILVDCSVQVEKAGGGKRTNEYCGYNDVGSVASGLNRSLAKRMDF